VDIITERLGSLQPPDQKRFVKVWGLELERQRKPKKIKNKSKRNVGGNKKCRKN